MNDNPCGDDNLLLYYVVRFDVLVEINPPASTKGGDVRDDPEEKEMVVIDERRKEKPF